MQDQFESIEQSSWVNDTDKTVSFKLMTDKKTGRKNSGTSYIKVVLEPGEKVNLLSVFDEAIRTTDKSGMIVGGLCPWLKKIGEEDKYELHSSLNYLSVLEEMKLKELATKIEKDKAMAEAIKVRAEQVLSEKSEVPKNKGGRPSTRKQEAV